MWEKNVFFWVTYITYIIDIKNKGNVISIYLIYFLYYNIYHNIYQYIYYNII
jgi:hypothetical protein